MMKIRLFCLLLIFLLSTVAFANDDEIPPIAAYKPDGNLYIFGLEDEPIKVSDEPAQSIHQIIITVYAHYNHIWSPDGTKLIFVEGGNLDSPIGVYDIKTREKWYLDAHALGGVPLSFSLDGQYLLYSSWGNPERDGARGESYEQDGYVYNPVIAKRIALKPNSEPESIEITDYLPDGMGNGLECPANFIQRTEALGKSSGDRLIETPSALLIANWKQLSIGGKDLTYNQTIGAFSQTNNALIMYGNNIISTLSLDTLTKTKYELDSQPYNVTLSYDERDIYYTSIEVTKDFSNYRYHDALWWASDCMFSSNTVSIHQLNLSDGSDTELYRAPFYAIGSIMPDPEGKYLYFTGIPNAMPEWIQRMLAGDCENDCVDLFYPDLYRLNLENGDVELILQDVIKATVNFGHE